LVIDFHTHIFPDRIASSTISMLSQKGNVKPYLDGRSDSLIASMKNNGIDKSVLLPVLTAPKQFDSVNSYTIEVSERSCGDLIPFGGIHPDCNDIAEKIKFLADSGFYGIKLHPDYQQTYADDERYINIITLAVKNNLAVTLHAGLDIGYPETIHCTPERAYRMLEKVTANTQGYSMRIILAHMGGYSLGKDVLRLLCGAPVYFDTGFTLFDKDFSTTLEIINKHGADKILFATDSPWAPQSEYLRTLRESGLPKEDINNILCENGRKLLGI